MADCLKRAIKQKQLERQLNMTLSEEAAEALNEEMKRLSAEEDLPGE